MDKNTLSNYGWIVIAVLVLSVMIALATPFGNFIKLGIESTTAGLFDTSENALNVVGMSAKGDSDSGSSTPTKDPALNPDDGSTPQNNDIYEHGDYTYKYKATANLDYNVGWQVNINTAVTDKNQTTYGAILESINGQPVTNMYMTFFGCTALTTAPAIPNSVTNMYRTFQGCTALTTAPEIPNSVTDMEGTFSGCTALTTAPVIPNSVTDMSFTFRDCTSLTTAPAIPNSVTTLYSSFEGCTSLTTAPEIPNSVTNMSYTFVNCTALITAPEIPSSVTNMFMTFSDCTTLSGTITINANIKDYSTSTSYYTSCFKGTTQPIVLVGSNTTMLEKLATTSSNGNVTVG